MVRTVVDGVEHDQPALDLRYAKFATEVVRPRLSSVEP
jgi:hypothetical protein